MSEFQRQSPKQKKGLSRETRNIIVFAGVTFAAILAAVAITVAIFFQKNAAAEQPFETQESTPETVEETEYDPQANKLDTEKYSGVILPLSEDGGEEYLQDTLFIGDSNTYRYMLYGKLTLENAIGVVGMGVQDVVSTKCVKFVGYSEAVTIPKAVEIMQPRRIVISFGTNNADGGWSAEYFVQRYREALTAIQKAYPYADIIISAIPPVAQNHSASINMATVDAYNVALAEMAETDGYKFLNSSEVLKDEATGFAKENYTIDDGYHMNQQAVDAYFEYVTTHTYITEDTRPERTAVPKRDEVQPYVITDGAVHIGTVSGVSVADSSSAHEGLEIVFTVNDSAMGSVTGETTQYVAEGEACKTVTATPAEGYVFAYWECTVGHIDDVGDPALTFTSPGGFGVDKVIVTANFKKGVCLVKTSANISGVGTAGILVGENEICGEVNVERGKSVCLIAYINNGYGDSYEFMGWMNQSNGQIIEGSAKRTFDFTPAADTGLVAVFQAKSYTATVTTDGSAGCSVTQQSNNGVLTVTASAGEGYVFKYWSVNKDERYSQDNPTSIQLDKNLNVVAHFEAVASSQSQSASEQSSSAASDSSVSSDSSDSSPT